MSTFYPGQRAEMYKPDTKDWHPCIVLDWNDDMPLVWAYDLGVIATCSLRPVPHDPVDALAKLRQEYVMVRNAHGYIGSTAYLDYAAAALAAARPNGAGEGSCEPA